MTSNSFRNFPENSSKIILEMFRIIQKLSKVPKISKEKDWFFDSVAPFGVYTCRV